MHVHRIRVAPILIQQQNPPDTTSAVSILAVIEALYRYRGYNFARIIGCVRALIYA
jgi:hypothetical protein